MTKQITNTIEHIKEFAAIPFNSTEPGWKRLAVSLVLPAVVVLLVIILAFFFLSGGNSPAEAALNVAVKREEERVEKEIEKINRVEKRLKNRQENLIKQANELRNKVVESDDKITDVITRINKAENLRELNKLKKEIDDF